MRPHPPTAPQKKAAQQATPTQELVFRVMVAVATLTVASVVGYFYLQELAQSRRAAAQYQAEQSAREREKALQEEQEELDDVDLHTANKLLALSDSEKARIRRHGGTDAKALKYAERLLKEEQRINRERLLRHEITTDTTADSPR